MGLFGKRQQLSDVEQLAEKSKNVVNVFTQTVVELKAINESISTLYEEKEQCKLQLEREQAALDYNRVSNSKIIGKIEKILE
jgi:hypothetical protein